MADITLRWLDRSADEEGFKIFRSTTGFDLENMPEPIAVLPAGTEEFTDTDLPYGVQYYYIIGTFNGDKITYSELITPSVESSDELLRAIKYCDLGPKEVIGSYQGAGYFGEVTSSELITGDALASLVRVSGGTSQNSNTNWLKFFIDDKIVFVSKKTIRHSVTWDQLNSANVINGSRIITIGQYQYRIGLLKGLNPDTSIPFTTGLDVPSGLNSEWNRLMYPVSIDSSNNSYKKHSQTIDNWAHFPQDDSEDGLNITGGNGYWSWCQEVSPLNPASRVLRGNVSVTDLNSNASSNTYAFFGWRVRLELVVP